MCEHMPNRAGQERLTLEHLNIAEKLIVWSFRVWTRADADAAAMHGIMRESFRVAEIPDAYLSFNEMLTLIQNLLNRQVEVRCPSCNSIGRDELLLISAVAQLQRGDRKGFEAVLSAWTPVDQVHHVLPSYTDFALTLYEKDFKPRR